jgi:hypothetical protein
LSYPGVILAGVCGYIWLHAYPETCPPEGCGQPYQPGRVSMGWDATVGQYYVYCQCRHTWHGDVELVREHRPCDDPACPAKTRP